MNVEEENVQVVVRIRPMQLNEKKNGDIPCVKAISHGKEVQVKVGPLEAQNYRCHKCFNPDTSQEAFFAECGITEMIDSTVEGYRACIFAYGQTGAGKTYTMVGGNKGLGHHDKHVGLIARSLEYLFHKLNQSSVKYRLKLSCLEIYQEHVYDLFAEEKERASLNIREHNTDGFFLEGLKYIECRDYASASSVLDIAVKNRQVGGHDLNNRSSRSHCLVDIYLEVVSGGRSQSDETEKKFIDKNDATIEDLINENYHDANRQQTQVLRGKISLIDLAGSERLKNTNSTGKVLQEAGFINRSLYVLGKVIAGLVRTNGDLNHKDVPYRDSKLTKLLISSLGGNSRSLLIACVSEAKGSQAETLRTLKFSMSCARIRNKPVKFLDPQEKLILDLKTEIKRLKMENRKLRSTLLTAPVSSNHYKSIFSDHNEEGSVGSPTSYQRAASAQGHQKLNFAHGQQDLVNKYKKQKQSVTSKKRVGQSKKMKISQSDLLAKYPQLNSILKREAKEGNKSSSDPETKRLRPQFKSALEQLPSRQAVEGESEGPKRRISIELLDEMVHRRAPGPRIFKDKASPIISIRASKQYQPADNYTKHLDQELLSEPSQPRNSKERDHFPIPKIPESSSVTRENSGTAIEAEQVISKSRKKSNRQVATKPFKPSPYLAHLFGKKNEKQGATKAGIKQKADSIIFKEDDQKNSEAGSSKEGTDKTLPHLVNLHDSIEKAFEDFGVAKSDRKPREPSSSTLHSIEKQKSRGTPAKADPVKLPNIISHKKSPKDMSGKTGLVANKLPFLPGTSKDNDDENDLSTGALSVLDNNFTFQKVETEGQRTISDTRSQATKEESTPDRLRQKLNELEQSLRQQRMEMEDNPGHVTNDMEEKYKALQLETKLMKVDLAQITGESFDTSPIKQKTGAATGKKVDDDQDSYEEYYDDDFADEFEEFPEKGLNHGITKLESDEPNSEIPSSMLLRSHEQATTFPETDTSQKEEKEGVKITLHESVAGSSAKDELSTPTSVADATDSDIVTSQKQSSSDLPIVKSHVLPEHDEDDDDGYGNEEFDDFED